MTLSGIVRKWLRATNKRAWCISEDAKPFGAQCVLRRYDSSVSSQVIFIFDDYASFDGMKFNAADPKFLTRLDRIIQFVDRAAGRYGRAMEEFRKQEKELLLEMLKIDGIKSKC